MSKLIFAKLKESDKITSVKNCHRYNSNSIRCLSCEKFSPDKYTLCQEVNP